MNDYTFEAKVAFPDDPEKQSRRDQLLGRIGLEAVNRRRVVARIKAREKMVELGIPLPKYSNARAFEREELIAAINSPLAGEESCENHDGLLI